MTLPENNFPYHEYCGFCRESCTAVHTDASYLLITNFWNEHDNIVRFFQRIGKQTVLPKLWIWIDDGSTDNSSDEIRRMLDSLPEVEIWLEVMPRKEKGDLDTIGKAYDRTIPKLIEKIDKFKLDYAAIMDVDNDPCPNYCARMMWLLDNHQHVGAAAGIPIGEIEKRKVGLPMGGGKFIRWSIMRKIKKYWDIAPDTLLNIKALANDYELRTWPVPMNLDELTTGFTSKGVFRQGRLNYYVGRPFWAVLFRALRRFILQQHGTQMLRGYFMEMKRGTWRFEDPDVERYYNRGQNPISGLLDVLKYAFKKM